MSVDYYEREAEKFIRQSSDVDMTGLYARFLPSIPPGGLVLDAGCGSGRDARSFLTLGYRVVAFDASSRMVEYASSVTGIDVLCMTFDDVWWQEEFDGIWCCASLLHVSAHEFASAAEKLLKALKPGGIWYMSFKLGRGQRMREGRLFVDHTDDSLRQALQPSPEIESVETWASGDMRPGRQNEVWLNALVKKKSHDAAATRY